MNRIIPLLLLVLLAPAFPARAGEVLYEENFETVALGQVPDDFLVLDGAFAVREAMGGRVLELPGTPLDNFGFLFGPAAADGLAVSARVQGSRAGRRFPTIALGLNGISGFMLRLAPMKRTVELVQRDEVLVSQPHPWTSEQWTRLKLQVVRAGEGWEIAGKVWPDGEPEPVEWSLRHRTTEAPITGKATAWAAPFSGTPIRFDDLRLETVAATAK